MPRLARKLSRHPSKAELAKLLVDRNAAPETVATKNGQVPLNIPPKGLVMLEL